MVPVIKDVDISEQADATKDGTMINSGFLDGLSAEMPLPRPLSLLKRKA